MTLLALAIAPGIAIILFVYLKDKYNREPVKHLLMCFLLGVLSAVPALIIEVYAGRLLDGSVAKGLLNTVISAFIIVAFTEEYCKYFMLRTYAYPKKQFDEPFDGITYSVMVSMGFATIENIGYVFQHGIGTGVMRMFLSVPAHAAFGVLMGYYVGDAKFKPEKAFYLRTLGIFYAVLFHGAYDCFLFLAKDGILSKQVSNGLLMLGALVSFVLAIRLSLRAIRRHQLLSKTDFDKQKVLALEKQMQR
jgi:RsiW-degrading membrane proteinase PrsW (M82 family)